MVKGSGKTSSPATTTSSASAPSGGGKKGKSKGKQKSGVKWLTEAQVDGQRKQLCMRYQNGSYTFSDCKFHHACAYPKPDGTACGLNHPAMQHASTWREPSLQMQWKFQTTMPHKSFQFHRYHLLPKGREHQTTRVVQFHIQLT